MNYVPHLNDLRNRLIAMVQYADGMVPIPAHAEEIRQVLSIILSYLIDMEKSRQETDKQLDQIVRKLNLILRQQTTTTHCQT